jgi:hypothetical protein
MALCALALADCSRLAALHRPAPDPGRFAPRRATAVQMPALPPDAARAPSSIATRGEWTTVRLRGGRVFYLHRERVFALRDNAPTPDFPVASRELVEAPADATRTIRTIVRAFAGRPTNAVPIPPGTLVVHRSLPRAVGDPFDLAVARNDATALLSDDPSPAVVQLYSRDCLGCRDDLAVLPQVVDRARRARVRVVVVSRTGDDPGRLARAIEARVRRDVAIVPDHAWSVFSGLDARFVPITMVVRRGRISRMYLGSLTQQLLPELLDDLGRS